MVDVFRYKAISLDGWGGLYVGGHRGFIHIRPVNALVVNRAPTSLHITDVKVEDKSIFFGNAEASGENTIHKIFLGPDDRNIEIFFSSLLYSLNAGCRIAYQLEGVDHYWIYSDNNRNSAFYNHLPKGTYKLRLKLEYERGKWTEGEVLLTIVKEPAFYETWFAYLVYVIFIGLCFYVVIRLYMRRIKLKSEVRLQEELTRTKLTYFTNVSHELLTPLTVISCISDYLDQKVPAVRQQSVMLKANAEKLKRLIQQVLDFRKMDVGKLKLNVSEGDIREFVLNICQVNFQPLALKKNITLAPVRLGLMKQPEADKKAMELLERIGLADKADVYPNMLSGGQKQRIAIVRALAMNPEVLLFDEPLSNLDAKLRESMRDELRALQQRLGITSLYVTHDQSEAMAISDKVVIMKDGVICQQGTPQEIYEQPASRFVANFIGKANFIDGIFKGRDGEAALVEIGGKTFSIPAPGKMEGVEVGGACCLTVRPESFLLTKDAGALPGTVSRATYYGAKIEYEVMLDEQPIIVEVYNPQLTERFSVGDTVTMSLIEGCVRVLK